MFSSMRLRERLPQLEVAVGESVTVFVLRHLEPIPEDDAAQAARVRRSRTASSGGCSRKGPETAHPFYPLDAPALDYRLPEFGLALGFRPTEFTQVNAGVNRVLVRRAVDLLDPRPGERVGDLFCGLGNFTLRARHARRRRDRHRGRPPRWSSARARMRVANGLERARDVRRARPVRRCRRARSRAWAASTSC